MSTQTKAKKTQHSYVDQNPVEAIKNVGSSVLDSAFNDVAKQGMSDLWEQLLGSSSKKAKTSGDLAEGEELHLGKDKKDKPERTHAAPAVDYHREIVNTERAASHEHQQVIKSQIQEILIELKKLSSASSEIAMEFKQVTVEQRIENPGEYHVTFFQWMLNVVREARTKIEDSGSWISAMKSKKGQKNYWAQFKKHGTSFGLSNERVVATQVG